MGRLQYPEYPARSIILTIWAIGSLVPIVLIGMAQLGEYDYAALWIAGKQVMWGDAALVYDGAVAQQYANRFTGGIRPEFPYPPHALFLFAPFALLPYLPSYFVWNLCSAAFFWWAARPYLPRGLPSLLSILTPASLICLDFGQTSLVVGGLWLLAFRGRWAAVALLTVKPHLGILGAIALRGRPELTRTAITAAVIMGAAAFLFGPPIWTAFLQHTLNHGGEIGDRGKWFFSGVAPGMSYGLWGWIPFAIAGAIVLMRRINAFTVSTASFLISPFGFHYDMTVACLGLGIVLYVNWAQMPFRHRLPIALAFIAPVIAVAGAWWVPPILLWALWAQVQYECGEVGRRGLPDWFEKPNARS